MCLKWLSFFIDIFVVRKRKKCVIIVTIISIVILIYFITNFSQILSNLKCNQLKSKALNEICIEFMRNQFTGHLCHELCQSKTLQLIECPNIDGHNGKDYVFVGHRYDQQSGQLVDKIVLKARTLTTFELIGSTSWIKSFANNRQLIIKAINDIMTARFGRLPKQQVISDTNDNQINYFYVNQLIDGLIDGKGDQLNETILTNIWLLIQDNEYVLSKIYPNIFPTVVGTCGHFYGVKYADRVIDISYFTPHYWPLVSQTFEKRIEIGIKIMTFLRDFILIDPKLELCDIKFEHLALMSGRLYLIDSDMIYTKKAVIESIEWISHCSEDSDCDFIDCKGVCIKDNKCVIEVTDDDLSRVCRNIFFMGKLYNLIDLGLFSQQTNDLFINKSIQLIHNHCFNRTDLISDINAIHLILLKIKSKLSNKSEL
ncbi:divergent protein kinase domain 1A-like [Oppia nitens]|uniref:divergent protein kinase domain 1A-like n=1 Tax=Oppia nitens TaxID=1686743 RepID=UPI0023DB2ED4|nr:divergent protein kinase domain 1A-like [Oppia nitens]